MEWKDRQGRNLAFRNEPKVALEILQEVAYWLQEQGAMLWEPDSLKAENLVTPLTEKGIQVVYVEDEPAATFALQWEDPLFWPEIQPDTSGFIHKLAIRRTFAGQDLFMPILRWCLDRCQEKGIDVLRLDTEYKRPKLKALYEGYGFVPVRRQLVKEGEQEWDCQLYAYHLKDHKGGERDS
jgi:hypothetical protein